MSAPAARAAAAACVALGIALAGPAYAQTAQQECDRDAVDSFTAAQLGAWASVAPALVAARLKSMTDAGHLTAALDSAAAIYLVERPGGTPPTTLAGLSEDERRGLLLQRDSARLQLAAIERDPSARDRGSVDAARFAVRANPLGDGVKLFNGRDAELELSTKTPDTRRSVCWFALAARDVLVASGGVARTRLLAALQARVERWDNFTKHGYSMLPHELLINGFLPRRSLEPPSVQVILLHPSAAAQMTSDNLKSLNSFRSVATLAVEPAGLLFYGPQERWYAGASWVTGFPSGERASSGVMLHYSPLGRAGYVWRRDDAGRRRHAVVLSMDLYKYLTGVADQWTKLKNESVASCLTSPDACIAAAKLPPLTTPPAATH